jgi:hypothetical protein
VAPAGGHLEILKYALEMKQGIPWDENTCKSAAGIGHLEALVYAHENGCPWNAFTCSEAAKEGHLDCVKFAHENGCPWNSDG